MTPFLPCGNTSEHESHEWPENAHPDELSTCDGVHVTSHPVSLVRVTVPYIGRRYRPVCSVCGQLPVHPTRNWADLSDAESVRGAHEREGRV